MNDCQRRTDPWMEGPLNASDNPAADSAALGLMTLCRLGPRHATSVTLRIAHTFPASAERVFGSWLDADVAGRWLFAMAGHPLAHAELDARVGGTFHLRERRLGDLVEYAGTYLEIAPPRRLVFTLSIDDGACAATRVTVAISPMKSGCELTLTHENVPHAQACHLEGRWTGALYGLAETLDETAAEIAAPRRGS